MGRVSGICSTCGRASYDIHRCGVCGATVCGRCIVHDINVCKRCMQKGLWVSDKGPE